MSPNTQTYMMHLSQSQKVLHWFELPVSLLLDCKLSTWARSRSFGKMVHNSNSTDSHFEAIGTVDFRGFLPINTLTKHPYWRQPRSLLLQSGPANLGQFNALTQFNPT